MGTKAKIRIADDDALRRMLDAECAASSQIRLCQYALQLAAHVLDAAHVDAESGAIADGYAANRSWQDGGAHVYDVRQAALRIHRMAKDCADAAEQAALRVVGHAVATAHMREHAMVASDYAVKVVNLLHPDDADAVKAERQWQIACLKRANGAV